MNGRIILSVLIAFTIIFSSLFYIHFTSIPLEQESNRYSTFSESVDITSYNLFILGSSHVGQLNSKLIIESIKEKNTDYNVFNLATNGDTPERRISNVDDIVSLNPEIIFYGISYRDFVSSSSTIESENILLNLKLLFKENVPEDLESLNPQLISRQIIRDVLNNYGIIDIAKFDIRPPNTRFFSLGNAQTLILEDPDLERLVTTVNPQPHTLHISSINNPQIESFKKIIEEFQEHDIKVVVFTTPIHDFYLEHIPNETNESFEQIINNISNEYEINVYDFTKKYSGLHVWNNLDHIAYNDNSNEFSNDIVEMITEEIDD